MEENAVELSPTLLHKPVKHQHWYSWEKVAPYVFISPFYILFAIFGAFPILFSLWISFMNWKGVRGGTYVGLDNYAHLFADPNFQIALVNTVILGFIYIPLMVVLSLGLAAILNRPMRLRGLYRTGFFLPVVTSMVVVGILFGFFFGSTYSPLGSLLALFGIPYKGLLGMAIFMKPVILIMLLWRWVGYNMMIMLAGLQSIPAELYDAGRIDGADGIQSFFYITMPLMRRVIAFAAILSTIGMFNVFDEAYMIGGSGGGPEQAGLVTGVFIFREAFSNFRFGYAAAVAYVIALIIIALSVVQIYTSERTATD
jgi:ABC-type sugar transport system permease subunit